jgi:hypothetical protein
MTPPERSEQRILRQADHARVELYAIPGELDIIRAACPAADAC